MTQVYALGGRVTVKVLRYSSSYTSELWVESPGSPRLIALSTQQDRIVSLGSFTRGAELVLGLHVRQTGDRFRSGPASRNPDDLVHANVVARSDGRLGVGFEDKWGGGDKDYDDAQFLFSGGIDDRPPAPAAKDTRGHVDMVLLGDSYSAGNAARDAHGNRSYYGPYTCYRSHDNWAEKHAARLRVSGLSVTMSNRACSGNVTDDVLGPHELSGMESFAVQLKGVYTFRRTPELRRLLAAQHTCEPRSPDEYFRLKITSNRVNQDSGGKLSTVEGLCSPLLRAQVDSVTKDTDLVVFTMGGNDLGFSSIIKSCFTKGIRTASGCQKKVDHASGEMTRVQQQLAEIFRKIRLRSNAKVALLGYPYLERYPSYSLVDKVCNDDQCYDYRIQAGKEVRSLGDAGGSRQAAAVTQSNHAAGTTFVTHIDTLRAAFAKHEPTASKNGAPDRWLNNIGDTGIYMEWYHPNPEGQTVYAKALAEKAPKAFARTASSSQQTGSNDSANADPSAQQRRGAADIALVLDTGSTSQAALASLRARWSAIVAAAQASTDGARFALVTAGPAPDLDAGDDGSRVVVPFTDDPSDVDAALADLTAQGPGNWRGAALSGIAAASSLEWRTGAKHLSYVVTDTSGAPGPDAFEPNQVIEAAGDAVGGVRVSLLDTAGGFTTENDVTRLVDATGGEVLPLAPEMVGAELEDLVVDDVTGPYASLPDVLAGAPGDEVRLDASSTFHPDGALLHYRWDVDGDGVVDAVTDGPQLAHTYLSPYDGYAAVTVSDALGRTARAVTRVTVNLDDRDGVADIDDNCPRDFNPDQEDRDTDGLGDACDARTDEPAELQGVSVVSWEDKDGDSTLNSIEKWRRPHFNIAGRLTDQDDQDWLGLQWPGGTAQLQVMGLRSNVQLLLTDQEGRLLGVARARSGKQTSEKDANSQKLRIKLPAGRYCILVRPAAGRSKGDLSYRVNATRIGRR